MRIVVTGAGGFIGGVVKDHLTSRGDTVIPIDRPHGHTTLLDMLSESPPPWATTEAMQFDAVVHLGACTDTLCHDKAKLDELNTEYSKKIWDGCVRHRKILIYASSAATYGDGGQGFEDDTEKISSLKPLNPYAVSKQLFDLYAIEQAKQQKAPPQWAGLKFFNVYGPTEQSKGRMASMAYQIYHQIKKNGSVRLFKHGHQRRDWVYVGDVARVIEHMFVRRCSSIYNVGSGESRSFNEISNIVFELLGKMPVFEYIDMPAGLESAYQSNSKADLTKLQLEYQTPMTSFEQGVKLLHEASNG